MLTVDQAKSLKEGDKIYRRRSRKGKALPSAECVVLDVSEKEDKVVVHWQFGWELGKLVYVDGHIFDETFWFQENPDKD